MRKNMCASLAILLLAGSAVADLEWYVGVDYRAVGPDDPSDRNETSFTTLLQNSPFDPSVGYMVQLIYTGADNQSDPASPLSSTGVGGDDMVVDTRWFGAGLSLSDPGGAFNAGYAWGGEDEDALDDLTVGLNFFVRAWVGVSLDPAQILDGDPTARIPEANAAGHRWYGDSGLYVNLGDDPEGDGGLPTSSQVDFGGLGGGIVANQLIPEPSSVVLVLVGGLLVARRMRRSGFESGSA